MFDENNYEKVVDRSETPHTDPNATAPDDQFDTDLEAMLKAQDEQERQLAAEGLDDLGDDDFGNPIEMELKAAEKTKTKASAL